MRPAAQAEAGGNDALVHDGFLGHGIVLTVVENGEIEHLRVLDRAVHELVRLDAKSVVGEGDHPGIF